MTVHLRNTVLFCAFVFPLSGLAQINRYFVSFKDKANTPYSISSPSSFLSQKSIQRRQKQNISIIEEDLPVNPLYVQQVKATGAKTFFTSKWWNGVLVQTDNTTINLVKALPFVLKTELVAPGTKLIGGRQSKVEKVNQTEASLESSEFQLQQLALDRMQGEGYRGEGVGIAQFDSGWIGVNTTSPFQPLYQEGRIKSVFNFVKNTTDIYSDDNHGTEVLSVMGAYSSGTFTGGVYKAYFYLFETEDKLSEYRIEEYNWAFAAERADSLGVDVINSSLGYNTFDDSSMDYKISDLDGNKAVVSITARKAVEKGMIVVCSAGNSGNDSWKTITFPADADGILSVGSVNSLGERSSFSSTGPTADKRLKPDVVALGSGTAVITGSGSAGSASGTSLSSPLVACLAAGLIQAFPNSSPKEIYNAIINSASQFKKPDNSLGYGVPNFTIAKSYLKYGLLVDAVSVFPNPVSNQNLNILFKEPTGQSISLSIYDLYGKRLSDYTTSVTWNNNPIQYDFSLLPNGVYLLELKSTQSNLVVKVVKSN
jgi:serine protease AprX